MMQYMNPLHITGVSPLGHYLKREADVDWLLQEGVSDDPSERWDA
jgi:hypothetical protein